MHHYLQTLAKKFEITLQMKELDIQRDRRCDLTRPRVRKKWLKAIREGQYFALILTPPCSTFSRAVWANDQGPYPVRSHRFPRGFPWNGGARKRKAELGNSLADFSYEAMEEQVKHEGAQSLMENPEHLGRTKRQRVKNHWPGSMWQWDQHEKLTREENVRTVAFHQQAFGTESPKPTRFLMRMEGDHPAFRDGPPKFSKEGWYEGPLEKVEGPHLIGQSNGTFNTAASAAWPPELCKWVAETIVYAFLRNSAQRRGIEDGAPLAEQTKEKDEEKNEIDPTWPLTPGGTGPARSCKWRGGMTPFHDGGCLSSPGRWPWGRRKYPEGKWKELRRELEEKVVKFAGGESELQKECFRMMSGERGCSLVQDEELLEDLRSTLRRFVGRSKEETQAEAGQPFRLELIKSLLEDAGDPDCQFLEKAKTGLPVGVLEELERTPESFERQTKWALEDDPTVEAELHRENYPSAEEHEEHLRSHLEKEVEEGLVIKMSEKEFVEKYGNHRAVAALAVLVEDELTGKKRVIHDATHGVRVNNRIRCKDKVRMPTAREKVTLLREFKRDRAVVVSVIGDVEKAHRRFKNTERRNGAT